MLFRKAKILLIFIAFLLPLFSSAQEPEKTGSSGYNPVGQQDVQLLYRNDFTLSGLVQTQGFGFNFRRGKHITGFKRGILEIELANIRHPKEIKSTNPLFDHSKGYFFGKMNTFHIFRPGFGMQHQLFAKQDRRGVEISLITFLGPSLGLAKPVYLQILNDIPSTPDDDDFIISTEKYDPLIHTPDRIYGRAPYFKGFGELRVYPGAYAKLGLNFEYGELDDDIKAMELGLTFDIYGRKIPIMANEINNQSFLTIYLQFTWGRRWF